MEVRAPRDLTLPISLEVPHCGVNSGRKLDGDTGCLPFAEKIRKFRFEVKW